MCLEHGLLLRLDNRDCPQPACEDQTFATSVLLLSSKKCAPTDDSPMMFNVEKEPDSHRTVECSPTSPPGLLPPGRTLS